MNQWILAHKNKYGWIICFSATMITFCFGGLALTGFSIYQPYLIIIGGLTNTQASSVLLFRNLFRLAGTAMSAFFIQHLDLRRTICFGGLCCSASFFVYSISDSYNGYCLAASLAGIGYGIGGPVPTSLLISRWFRKHLGLALGIMMSATGMSTIFSPVISFIIEHFSLRTSFFLEGIFVLTITFLCYMLIFSDPSCIGARPIGEFQVKQEQIFTSKDAPLPLYLIMMIGIFLFGIPGNTLHPFISVLYHTEGYSSGQVSLLVTLFGIILAIGKCSYGAIADRIGTHKTSWVFYTFVCIGSFFCCKADNKNMFIALSGVLMMGFGLAVTGVSISMYATNISTQVHYVQTVSRFNLLSSLGGLIFSTIPGIIADLTGSYIPCYYLLFGLALASALLLQITYWKITFNAK